MKPSAPSAESDPEAGEDERPLVAIFRSPIFHGHETFIRTHAAGLTRYRPLIVGLEDKGHVPPELDGQVVLAGPAERAALKLFGRAGGLADRLRPRKPALVHAHFATDGLLALPLAEALGVPLVTTLHGYDVSRTRRRMLGSGRLSWVRYGVMQSRLQARGRLFLAVSDALREQALAAGFPPERTLTHHLGVDLTRLRPGTGAPEQGLILHVGRLVEKKGSAVLIRALAEARETRPNARLVVLGEGPLRPRLEAQAAGLGLAHCVSFLGNRSPADVAAWMARAWLLAAPSLTAGDGDAEGLPTVIAEAAGCGLPVIATIHSGIPEAVIDGETGFLVSEGASAPLAARIVELLESPRLRTSMGRASRAMAERKFDSARQAARLEAHYDLLLGEVQERARRGRDGADSR